MMGDTWASLAENKTYYGFIPDGRFSVDAIFLFWYHNNVYTCCTDC